MSLVINQISNNRCEFLETKNYIKHKDRDFDKLAKYARQLRIENVMQNIIMPML